MMIRFLFIAPFALLGGCVGMSDAEFAAATVRSVPGGFIPIGDVRFPQAAERDGQVAPIFRHTYLRAEDVEMTRSISQVQFDNWFAEDGAELIGANLVDMTAIGSAGVIR